jgi:CheY-like chemotaxis protein
VELAHLHYSMHMEPSPIASFAGQHHDEIEACELRVSALFLQPAVDDSGRVGGRILAKILVVDDDPAVQMTIRLLLERAGHSVVVAGDGHKGLAAFESGDFDLLFLDIFMPGMDGFETMRMVRQHRPQIPIIVISGRPVSSEADTAPDFLTMETKLGAISSLQKPFRPADLLAAVTGCLEAVNRGAPRPAGGVASSP